MNVPKLRFKEFSEEWSSYELRQIAEINPKSKNLPESFVYIDLESVVSGRLVHEKKLLLLDAPSRAQRLLQEFDVLFQMVRPYQQNNFYFNKKGVYVASTGYAQIRTNQNNKFIYYSLHTQNFLDEVMNRCTGTSYPAINSSDLSTIILDVPSLPEQTKIASFLTAIDDKIAQLTQKHELLNQYKKGMMQQIFSQQLRFKDDEGEEFAEWEEVNLNDVSDVRDGTHDSPKYVSEGYPLITSKNLKNGKLDLNDINYISKEDFDFINKRSKVDKGDIIFGMIGTIGNPVLLIDDKFAIKNVALIKQKEELLNIYLIHYLTSSLFDRQVNLLNVGNTQKFLALGQIRALKILKPSLPEQTKIANFLSSIDQKIQQVAAQLEAAKQYKRGLLQQMFV